MKAYLRLGCLALVGAFVISMAGAGVASAGTWSTGSISRAIPDNGSVSVKIPVPQRGKIQSMQVALRAKHSCPSDLVVRIESPDGHFVILSDENGTSCGVNPNGFGSGNVSCSGNKTIFDDDATADIETASSPFVGRFQPEQTLETMNGRQMQGAWHLIIDDNAGDDTGTIGCVKLIIHHTAGG
jgi:subtilisin-like proprotein convertase family protein